MRAIAGMARSYKESPVLPVPVGASLLANLPASELGLFASKLAPTKSSGLGRITPWGVIRRSGG